ncbi:hypothetical protein [Poriferisphaera sp. WC338]|uniref:hypothetical protein n=1 Tax=Poriferisphaera sp. WC338 TaxID=3425129 RepID=UPI003D81ABC1
MKMGVVWMVMCLSLCLQALLVAQTLEPMPVEPPEEPTGETLVANPLYDNWALFGVGTSVDQTIVTKTDEGEVKVLATLVLKSIDDKQAVVSMTRKVVAANGEVTQPAEEVLIPKRVTQAEADGYLNPPGKVGEGEEVLEVLGKKIKARWVEVKKEDATGSVVTRIWMSAGQGEEDVIPGMLVKMSIKSEGLLAFTTEMSITGVEVKAN